MLLLAMIAPDLLPIIESRNILLLPLPLPSPPVAPTIAPVIPTATASITTPPPPPPLLSFDHSYVSPSDGDDFVIAAASLSSV